MSKRERDLIRKVIEEWNPFSLEDSIYGPESYEIYKCVVFHNYQNSPLEIANCIQCLLSSYAVSYEKVFNQKFDLEYDKCLDIAKKITNLIALNKNGDE